MQSRQKSRTLRRVLRRTPGGRTARRYVERKPKKTVCANCGKALPGVPRLRPNKLSKTPKTLKRPERMFGGIYCSACSRRKIIEMSRGLQ